LSKTNLNISYDIKEREKKMSFHTKFHEPHIKIHSHLRKHAPAGVRKAKKIFSFIKYPKLLLFVLAILVASYLFSLPVFSKLIDPVKNLGYLGIFLGGALTSLGFLAPFGIGMLTKITPHTILFGALVAGVAASIIDLLIFKVAKSSFADEFKRLEKTKTIKDIENVVKKNKHVLITHYLLYVFAGLILMTPLPDEIGISMLAGMTTIKPRMLVLISFVCHSIGAFFLFTFI
jgi:hypothetical protein